MLNATLKTDLCEVTAELARGPEAVAELSDRDLELVAGGKESTTVAQQQRGGGRGRGRGK